MRLRHIAITWQYGIPGLGNQIKVSGGSIPLTLTSPLVYKPDIKSGKHSHSLKRSERPELTGWVLTKRKESQLLTVALLLIVPVIGKAVYDTRLTADENANNDTTIFGESIYNPEG